MPLSTFFKLIRWKNVLVIAYVQILIKYLFFQTFLVVTALSNIQFILLLSSTLLITIAGNIINDIFDVKTDFINKPTKVIITKSISIEAAQKLYIFTNTFGIILGIILCLNIEKPHLSFVFFGTSLLLYFYSKKIKSKPFIGNIVVSFLICISMLLPLMFDIDSSIENEQLQFAKTTIYGLAFFAFFINLIREVVKDIEDINGDYNMNMSTLPIIIGVNRAKILCSVLCLIPISILLFIILNYSLNYKYTVLYLLFFTLIPLLYIAYKLYKIKSKKEFHKISNFLKVIMFLGINVLIIISLK